MCNSGVRYSSLSILFLQRVGIEKRLRWYNQQIGAPYVLYEIDEVLKISELCAVLLNKHIYLLDYRKPLTLNRSSSEIVLVRRLLLPTFLHQIPSQTMK